MNDKEIQEFQKLLKDEQVWADRAIKEIQKDNLKTASSFLNIRAGINNEFQRILQNSKNYKDKE